MTGDGPGSAAESLARGGAVCDPRGLVWHASDHMGPVSTGSRATNTMEKRMDWRHEAACRDVDPELFFPIGNTGPALVQIEEAKAVCRRCSVVDECLRWALETGQDAGVWGGLSEDERRALKRRNARLRARSNL